MRILAILAAVIPGLSIAQVTFRREFAPQEGKVTPIERPQRDEICLNGKWQFQPAPLPSGWQREKSGLPELGLPKRDGWEKTPIRIPSPWNTNAFPDGQMGGGDFRCFPSYPARWNTAEMGWLRRSFAVPAAWRGKRLFLHFDAVAGDTEVRVNGKRVGEHRDIFLPFDVDVTDAVRPGANELLVGVRKMSLGDRQGKYGRRTYQGGSMWGQAIVGIWQDVFLQAVPSVRVTDAFLKPNVLGDQLDADVTVANDGDRPMKVSYKADFYPWLNRAGKDALSAPEPKWTLGKPVLATNLRQIEIPPHATVSLPFASMHPRGALKAWSPEKPNLYAFVVRIQDPSGKHLDTKSTRFGWRTIGFDHSKVTLNGKPLVLKGDSWHFMGIPEMTRRYAWAWFRAMKDANLNAVRLHAEPYPSFFLDMADEMGILVLDEDAVWASDGGPKIDSDEYWQDTETHLRNLVLRDRNHPSVFGWSVSNEVMAVVRNVFHAPKEYEDRVNEYFGRWYRIVSDADPTRVWVSADGEDDGNGQLPTYVIHYGDKGTMRRAAATNKPWGVGEAGPAYYGTPQEIARMSGNPRAYLSFMDRMEGVAKVSYDSLADQRETGASYRSVFNMVWYGLKPLELGLRDTSRAPLVTDGVFFPPFVEGKPGVQPERLGPYCTTLNPGYDARLPLYAPWPLFTAIRNANAEPPVPYAPRQPFAPWPNPTPPTPIFAGVRSQSKLLADSLEALGARVSQESKLLFVSGTEAPPEGMKKAVDDTLAAGGTVFVWGVSPGALSALNAVLPDRIELTSRTASSLVPVEVDPLTMGLTPAQLYFSEKSPSRVLEGGLSGPLLAKAKVLLAACDTDWTRWNRQPETTKTGMVLRSEREAKPSGVALAKVPVGGGTLIVCNLPLIPTDPSMAALYKRLLANLGVALGVGKGDVNFFDAEGTVERALALGWFESADFVPETVNLSSESHGRRWTFVHGDGRLNLGDLQDSGKTAFLSFWLYSPKALDNLLLDPHLPVLDIAADEKEPRLWINGKEVPAHALPLQQGWNHVLLRVSAAREVRVRLKSSQSDFLGQMRGSAEKP